MPKRISAAYVLFVVVSVAGILTDARSRRRPASGRTSQRPADQTTIPSLTGGAGTPMTALQKGLQAMMFLSLAGIIALACIPLIARAAPASNEDIRSHYGINVIDNPSFQGNTFLKAGEYDLAYVCDRPNYHALKSTDELHCWLP